MHSPKLIPFKKLLFFTVASLLCGGSLVRAQVASDFQITKIEPSMPLTPVISYNGTQKPGPPKKWMEVEVSFSWKPRVATEKFSDDITLNYYVLLANRSSAFPQGTLLSGQVVHTTLPANLGELKSVMYVSPRALERFFDGKIPASAASAVVDIGVTISRQGQVVALKSLKGNGAWWPQYQQTVGYLLNKDETPFAPLNWDYYEAVKKP